MIRRWLSVGWPLAVALAAGLALLLWGVFQPPAPAAAICAHRGPKLSRATI